MKIMTSIPLREAMICWNPSGEDKCDGEMLVVRHPDLSGRGGDLILSDGACNQGWTETTDDGRLAALFTIAMTAMIKDGLTPEQVHEALSAIREYRNHVGRLCRLAI